MRRITARNRIKYCIITITGILLAVIITIIATHMPQIDKIILLENRNKEYWDNFSPDKAEQYDAPISLNQMPYTEIINNNLLNENVLVSGDYNGFNISTKGSSILINGTVLEDTWINLVINPIILSKGIYYMAINSTSKSNSSDEDVYAFLNGKDNGNNVDWICEVKGNSFLTVDDPIDSYMITIKLFAGQSFQNLSIMPVISKISDEINIDTENIRIWHAEDNALMSLTSHDKDILYRSIKYQNNKYAWQSIVFSDGSGIQFNSKTTNYCVKGMVDPLGRIEGSEYTIKDDIR